MEALLLHVLKIIVKDSGTWNGKLQVLLMILKNRFVDILY